MNPHASSLQNHAADQAAPTHPAPSLVRPLRILVADDSSVTRATIAEELQPLGAEILDAEDGRTALRKAAQSLPDMITLDVEMPDMDGYTVCRALKHQDRTESIPVLMVAARPRADESTRAFLAGAAEYFVKPFVPGTLREFAQAVVDRHRARRHQQIHILVADSKLRVFLEHMLGAHGYPVSSSTGVEDLLERPAIPYDLLVLDLDLPDNRGFDTLLSLRDRNPLQRLPVVALTESSDRHRVAVAFNSGVADVLRHPVFPEELVARIENQLRLFSLEKRLVEEATIDHLTGLFNRRQLARAIVVELKRAARHGESLGILIADLDEFKRINDTYGHAAGDEVLRACSREMSRHVRATDIAARYGGEEFVFLLPGDRAVGLKCVAERIRDAIENLWVPTERGTLRVTVSIGGTYWEPDAPHHQLTLPDLLDPADQALYAAKAAGRNRVVILDSRGASRPAGQPFLR
ncbi:MAG: diguanylate cyclase [Polyangiaceae bacterium]|nr:diguanylate cyclase [Polyangiaceae bacterium]